VLRRSFLIGLAAVQLGGCDSHSKRIGPYHWLSYTDGQPMIIWGSSGEGICGIDFYSRDGERRASNLPLEYGITKDWLFVKTSDGLYAVPQNKEGYSAGKPLNDAELKALLSKHSLVMPKMKPI